jgi:hypothetical protein
MRQVRQPRLGRRGASQEGDESTSYVHSKRISYPKTALKTLPLPLKSCLWEKTGETPFW